MMKPLDKNEWEYQLLALDVKGERFSIPPPCSLTVILILEQATRE
jgi:hypothetical protein